MCLEYPYISKYLEKINLKKRMLIFLPTRGEGGGKKQGSGHLWKMNQLYNNTSNGTHWFFKLESLIRELIKELLKSKA